MKTTLRWWVPILVPVMGFAGGVILGAFTNLINGEISPRYFAIVMGWNEAEAGSMAIGQGMFEGGILGAVFGIVVAISFAASTRLHGRFRLALRTWVLAVGVALTCWGIGGLCGFLIALITPASLHLMFPPSRAVGTGLTKFAWVGGSIWGAYGGALLGCVIACIYQHIRWHSERLRSDNGFDVLPAQA